jgi:hypothetical protein
MATVLLTLAQLHRKNGPGRIELNLAHLATKSLI